MKTLSRRQRKMEEGTIGRQLEGGWKRQSIRIAAVQDRKKTQLPLVAQRKTGGKGEL